MISSSTGIWYSLSYGETGMLIKELEKVYKLAAKEGVKVPAIRELLEQLSDSAKASDSE